MPYVYGRSNGRLVFWGGFGRKERQAGSRVEKQPKGEANDDESKTKERGRLFCRSRNDDDDGGGERAMVGSAGDLLQQRT